MLKKLKSKISIKRGLFFSVFTLSFVYSFVFYPIVYAATGDTEYGKWYTADEIVLRSEVEVAGSDGVFKKVPFVRVGNEKGKSSVKVKIKIFLEKPSQLVFAPDEYIGSADRDGVRAKNRLGAFLENIYGLVGLGSSYGAKDLVKCDWKDVRRFFRFWEDGQEIEFCVDNKGGGESNNDGMSQTIVAGQEIYNNTFTFTPSEFEKMTFKPGGTFVLQVWPQLRVNTGDTTLTEALVASSVVTASSIASAKAIGGISARALELAQKIKNKVIKPEEAVQELTKIISGLPTEEARVLAQESIDWATKLSPKQKITQEVLEAATASTIRKLTEKGLTLEKAAILARDQIAQIAAQAGSEGPKILTAAGNVIEAAAVKEGVGKAAAKTASVIAKKALVAVGTKWIPIAGWVWTGVDVAFYLDTFSKNSLTLYNTNAHNIYIQLYDLEAAAIEDKDLPPPAEIRGQLEQEQKSKIGSPSKPAGDGSGLIGFVNTIIGVLISFLSEIIYVVFFTLIAPLIQAVLSIHTYTDAFAAVIYPGWELVRNVSNIFFIVALIAIGLATLFRLQSYQFRHLLVQLIIAALLVNFSLVIGQAVLGIADTVQNQFLPSGGEGIRNISRHLMVENTRSIYDNFTAFSSRGYFADSIQPLFFLALAAGSFMVFLAIAAFLVIRIVMLWILLMVSPIAYVAGILPATEHYRKEWWTTFLKYAFFTPIMAFFLNVAAYIATTYSQTPVLQKVLSDPQIIGTDSSVASFVFKVSSNIVLLVFLIVALKVSESFGIYGASAISNIAKKGIFAPFQGGAFVGKAAGNWAKKQYDKKTLDMARGNWFYRQAFKALHPVAFVKAIREEGKEERELYKTGVESGATEVARKQYGWRRKTESPMFLFDEHKGKELFEKEEGEWSENEQQMIAVGIRLTKEAQEGDLRAQIKLKHWFKEAFRHKNLNEAMEGENGLAKNLFGHKLNYNSDNIRYFFQELTKKGVIDKNFTGEFLKKLSKDGYEISDFNGVELVYSDPETGHPHMIEMEYKGNGDALPVGWEDIKDASGSVIKKGYVTRRLELIKQADTEARAEAARLGVTEEGEIGVMIQNKLKELEDGKKDKDGKVIVEGEAQKDKLYANSMHAERSRLYMKVNMSKRTGSEKSRAFHDSVVNVGVVDGKVRVSDAGKEVLWMDANMMYAMARDNMPAKTRDKFMRFMSGVMEKGVGGLGQINSQLERMVEDKYREEGVVLTTAQKNKAVDEQRNLWLAAGYSILSSTPGATVMKNNFEEVTKAAQARIVGLSDVDVRKFVKGEIDLPRTLNDREMQAVADQATIDTRNLLVDEIMRYKK